MSKFGNTLFSGSPFIYWTLAPILLFSGAFLSFVVEDRLSVRGLMVIWLQIAIIMLVLVLTDPKRFHWAARCLTGMIFLSYTGYLVNQVWGREQLMTVAGRSESSPLNAIMGLVVIGLPCLWYTVKGRFERRGLTED